MMASIPNMRSTPLPVPAGKTGSTEPAPGDFAAQLPLAREPFVTLQPEPCLESGELVIPDIAGEIAAVEGEAPEATAETPETGETGKSPEPQQAEMVIPFLQTPPAMPGPRVQLPAAAETPPANAEAPVVQAPTARRGRPACEPGGKATLPLPPASDAPETTSDTPQVETRQIEAAVKELLQRKQVLAKPVVTAPRVDKADPAKPEAAPIEAKGQVLPQVQVPAAPAASQTPAPANPAMTEQPQPAPIPAAPPPAVAKPEATGTVEPTRTADLAAERQLDLARDGEWLDRLARDIARAGASDTPLRFRLHPQTLGHLQVELRQGDHGTAVRLTVETEAARQLLADAQPRLAAEARAQGVRIAETHVDLSGFGRHAPGDQRRQDEAQQTPFVRTARGPGEDAVTASARSPRRDRLDRYA